MITSMLIVLLTVSVSSIQLSQNLQWKNYTGSSVTPQMVTAISNTIDLASAFYDDNALLNAKFIAQQLNTKFKANYQVFIDRDDSSANYSWIISQNQDNLVSWTGVNKLYPKWAYLIWPIAYNYTYVNFTKYQTHISKDQEKAIRNIITFSEAGMLTCKCDISPIHYLIQEFYGGKWNVLCKKLGVGAIYLHGYMSPLQNQWMYIASSKGLCDYVIFNLQKAQSSTK